MPKRLLFIITGLVLMTVLWSMAVWGELKEDKINFNYQKTKVVNINDRWKVVDGNMWLLDFGASQAQAIQALQVIKFYHLNEQCFIGRPNPVMRYYLVNGTAPVGAMDGEDSIHFDNKKLRVVNDNSRWKIIEGTSHMMLDFDQKEADAWTALRIIWKYDFNYICFVGRPNPPLMYFRR